MNRETRTMPTSRRNTAFLALCAILGGCVTGINTKVANDYAATASWQRRALTGAEKHAVSSVVKGVLKDPESAHFEFLPHVENPKSVYCGFVSAKNSLGGYGSPAAFVVGLASVEGKPLAMFIGMESAITDPDIPSPTDALCARNGYQTR